MKLGELLGSKLTGGEVIELRSDLGGGKTTFTKGIVKGAGSSDVVASPTFTLKKIYKGHLPVSPRMDAAQGSSEERARSRDATLSERKSVTDKAMRHKPAGAAGSAGGQGKAVREIRIYHYDFYRLSDPGIMRDELAESINDKQAVTIIEWSDIVADVLPAERISIDFKPTANDESERLVTISHPESWAGRIREVETERAGSWP